MAINSFIVNIRQKITVLFELSCNWVSYTSEINIHEDIT